MFVRTLLVATHVHVILDMYLEWMITTVKVLGLLVDYTKPHKCFKLYDLYILFSINNFI